jgi:hypothetical protein
MPAMKIMFIRHAEKPTRTKQGVSAAGAKDPEELVVHGWQRSGALVRFFAPRDGKFVDPRLSKPNTIFASGIGGGGKSLRPQHTVQALAKELGLILNRRYPKGAESRLAKAAVAAKGPVLIAWQHEAIPAIVNAIVGNKTTCPQKWRSSRFDLVWVLDRRANGVGWKFRQVPQMLLPGDSDEPIARSRK